MLDRYTFGVSERVSPESPVLIVKAINREVRLGGAGNVAANCAALGADVVLGGLVGDDSDGATVQHLLAEQNIESLLVVDRCRCTTVKDRILSQAAHRTPQHVLRLDCECTKSARAEVESLLVASVEVALEGVDLILVSDYGKGVCTNRVLTELISLAAIRGVPIFVDPAFHGDWSIYQGATLIKPNRREAEVAVDTKIISLATANGAAAAIAEKFQIPQVAITLDQDGSVLYRRGVGLEQFTTDRHEVSDVTGAGDTVFAVLGAAVSSGYSIPDAMRMANVAGGIQVERQGATTVSWDDIHQNESVNGSRKIVAVDWLERQCSKLRSAGKRIVFTNGCFDLLHVGHVTYLQQASHLGDALIVAINTDSGVRRLKGSDRPVNGEGDRAAVLAALACVDFVVIFEDETPESLLRRFRPDVLVKGGDVSIEEVVGREIVEGYGGEVAVVSEVPRISTSKLLKKSVSSAN